MPLLHSVVRGNCDSMVVCLHAHYQDAETNAAHIAFISSLILYICVLFLLWRENVICEKGPYPVVTDTLSVVKAQYRTHLHTLVLLPMVHSLSYTSVVGNDSQSKAWFSGSSERDHEETRYLATTVAVSYSRCNLKKVAPCELSGCYAIWNPVILVFQENCEEQKDAEHTLCLCT